jgi:hypothetical protein
MSEVTETVVDGFTDTQGGLWVMSHLPLASQNYHVFTSDSCRGEDCWKAKGVQWVRLMLQDPGSFEPKCRTSTMNCNKPPSGDDFIDVFNTHLQANEPLLCKLDSDWADIKAAVLAVLASFVDPVLAFHAAILIELVEGDLNCNTLTDRQARLSQLRQMNKFISAVAATDRSSLVLGDFNINGKPINGSEYQDALVALKIAAGGTPDDDTVSALPPGGFDIRHGDILRERTDVDFATGKCTGTFIDEAGGTPDATCNAFAGGTDAKERLDYILVRPPQLISQWQGYPRWFISAVDPKLVWTSPFPSLSGAFSSTPLRLSDHKPITAALSFARLSNPPKYNPSWKHKVEQRVISVDATDVDDCLGCGEVDHQSDDGVLEQPAPGLRREQLHVELGPQPRPHASERDLGLAVREGVGRRRHERRRPHPRRHHVDVELQRRHVRHELRALRRDLPARHLAEHRGRADVAVRGHHRRVSPDHDHGDHALTPARIGWWLATSGA